MIDEKTLLASSHYKDPYQKEKDYIEEVFLSEIYCRFTDQLVFKGGTALSKFYSSPRFSDDLDFSVSHRDYERTKAEKLLNEIIDRVNKSYSVKVLRSSFDKHMIKYELSLRGPLFDMLKGHYQHLKIEINENENVIEDPNVINREPGYPDVPTYIAVVMTETEILAEKIVTLLFRPIPKARDMYDLYYMLNNNTRINVGMVDRKLHEYGHSFDKKHLKRRLSTIERVWDKELPRLIPHNDFISFSTAQKLILENFKGSGLL